MGQTLRSRSQGKKIMVYPRKDFLTRNTHLKYQSSSTRFSKVIRKIKVFKKKVKLHGQGHSQCQKYWYPRKDFLTRNTRLKYQSSSTPCSKVIGKIKVIKKWVKLLGQGYRVNNFGTCGKVLSQGILMWNIKALALTVQKLLARLKFSKK